MIKQIGLPLRGRPILLITRMITDRIGLHSVLFPLLIVCIFIIISQGCTANLYATDDLLTEKRRSALLRFSQTCEL